MQGRKVARWFSVVLLLGVFFYASTVRDFHYGFSAHYHSSLHADQCDNHIHSTEKEADCIICGIDIHTLYDTVASYYSYSIIFLPKGSPAQHDTLIVSTKTSTHYLRGPPSQA